MLEIREIHGRYTDISRTVLQIPTFAAELKRRVPRQIAEAFIEAVKTRIETQDLPSNWFLQKRYQDRKKREGHDQRILVATGQLLESLAAFELENGVWGAGVHADAGRHQNAQFEDVLVMDVLRYIEQGTYNSPNPRPRPIIRDTLEREQDSLRDLACDTTVRIANAQFHGLVTRQPGLSRPT